MKKVISITIALSMIFMLVAFFPVFSSAAVVPEYYVDFALTNADWDYLFQNGYLELSYYIDGSSMDTELTAWQTRRTWGTTFYTYLYGVTSSWSLSMNLHLPFSFKFKSGSIRFSPSVYMSLNGASGSGLSNRSLLFSNSVSGYSSVSTGYNLSYDIGKDLFGISGGSFYYGIDLSSSTVSDFVDTISFNSSTYTTTGNLGGFFDFQNVTLYVTNYVASEIMGKVDNPNWGPPSDPSDPSDPGGDPSDPGGDPSDPGGGGGTDLTPLISYLQSLDSTTQNELNSIQSGLELSISDLSDSSESAMDFFDNNESLKSDLGLDIEGSSDALSEFDSSLSGVSVSYNGDSYSADYGANLVDFAEDYKTLLQHPLIYFMLFFMITIALASYIIYGRA